MSIHAATTDLVDAKVLTSAHFVLLAIGILVLFCDGFDAQVVSYVTPTIAAEWGVEKAAFAPIFAANLAGLMIGAVLIAPLSDIISRRLVTILSVTMFGLFSLLPLVIHDVPEFTIARFAAGVALGAAMPCMIASSSDFMPAQHRTVLVALLSCAFSLGITVCGATAGYVISALNWRAMFWIGGLLPLVLVPLLVVLLPESPAYLLKRGKSLAFERLLKRFKALATLGAQTSLTKDKTRVSVLTLFHDGYAMLTLLIWLAYFCSGASLYFLANWLPTLVTDAGWSASEAAFTTAIYQFGGLLGGILVGIFVDRAGVRALAVAMLTAAFAIAATGQVSTSLILSQAFALLVGLLVVGSQHALNAYTGSILYPTDRRATGLGWALGSVRLGGVLAGSLGAGFVLSLKLPVTQTFMIIGVPELIGGAAVLLLWYSLRARERVNTAGVPESSSAL